MNTQESRITFSIWTIVDGSVDKMVKAAKENDFYMPALASALRLKADELAKQFPDDVNDGFAPK